jgi:hypothetical protein
VLPSRVTDTSATEAHAFHPRVIDGTFAALDLEAIMDAAAVFEGYDSVAAVIDDSVASPTIWDDALDVRLSCL